MAAPSLPREADTTGRVSQLYVVTYCTSQAMGKLGTSLSSGHVMVNGTRTQVLLVGAPTQGRSPAMKLHFFTNSCVTSQTLEPDHPHFDLYCFSSGACIVS